MSQTNKFSLAIQTLFSIIEDISSIIIAVVLVIIDRTSPGKIEINEILLAILSIGVLLAISNLRDRLVYQKRISHQTKQLAENLSSKVIDPICAINFFSKKTISPEELSDAKKIFIIGITLVNTIGTFHQSISNAVKKGSNVKIILLDDTSEDCINQLMKRSWGKVSQDYYKRRLAGTNELLRIISENINDSQITKGKLSVGKLPFVPSFGIILIQNDKDEKKAYIEIYHHLTNDEKPSFILENPRDSTWLNFFEEQFESMWQISTKEELVK